MVVQKSSWGQYGLSEQLSTCTYLVCECGSPGGLQVYCIFMSLNYILICVIPVPCVMVWVLLYVYIHNVQQLLIHVARVYTL